MPTFPALAVSGPDADRLRRGQPVLLRGRDAPVVEGTVYATSRGTLIALGEVERGELHPKRIFNLPMALLGSVLRANDAGRTGRNSAGLAADNPYIDPFAWPIALRLRAECWTTSRPGHHKPSNRKEFFDVDQR